MPKQRKKTAKKTIPNESSFAAERAEVLKQMLSRPPTKEEVITRRNFIRGVNGPTEPPFG